MSEHRVGTALDATQRLVVEHQKILIILSYLEAICDRLKAGDGLAPGLVGSVLELLQGYVEKNHNGKKRSVLFRALLNAGMSPISGLLAEVMRGHEAAGQMLAEMQASFARHDADAFLHKALEYADATKQLMLKEKVALYPHARQLLGAAELVKLADKLERMDTAPEGSSAQQRYYGMIDGLRAHLRAKKTAP